METGDQYRGNFREIQKAPAIWGGGVNWIRPAGLFLYRRIKRGRPHIPAEGYRATKRNKQTPEPPNSKGPGPRQSIT